MARIVLDYEVPAEQNGALGSRVHVVLVYDKQNPNLDGSYNVTDARGTYRRIDTSGNVVSVDKIIKITPLGSADSHDNTIHIDDGMPFFDAKGISFRIDSKNHSRDGNGHVRFHYKNDRYLEVGNIRSAQNVAESQVCFVSGTMIQTSHGEVAVEALSVGDAAVTASGALRPIRWLGHRTIDCRNRLRSHEVMPVHISAHAFGPSRPVRDLFVSPGHAICVDVLGEVLIPAGLLVNGSSIRQVEVDSVTYWHVELDSHDVILAENLPAESYLEMGNRAFFAEEGVVALCASPDAQVLTHADFCRPYVDGGAVLDAVRAQLQARATAIVAGEGRRAA